MFAYRAVLSVQRSEHSVDSREQGGYESELGQSPKLAHGKPLHRFLLAAFGLTACAKTSR